jgi:hypothetical protein
MKYLVVFFFLLAGLPSEAQQRPQQGKNSATGLSLSDRVYFGGGGSFGGGNNALGYRYTYISVSPLVGYRLTVPWSAGVGVNYIYYRYPEVPLTLNQYGISPFTRYQFGKLFAYAEYSVMSVPTFDNTTRALYNRLPIGLGYSIPIGEKAALNAMALYDVLYNKRTSVFYSPWVLRVFVSAGALTF